MADIQTTGLNALSLERSRISGISYACQPMSRIFITGSSDGLGRLAGELLISQGHSVVLHARNQSRALDTKKLMPKAEAVVVGDLSTITQTRAVAQQANALGSFDAVIHNAALGYQERRRIATEDGLSHVFEVNTLAPFILTALMRKPKRLIYMTSGLHQEGDPSLDDLQWEGRPWRGQQAYSDSKFHDVLLAFAIARRWPDVLSNAVDPGWVPTKMGGPRAPDNLEDGYQTQAWLAVSDDKTAKVSGELFYHKKLRDPHPATRDLERQDKLMLECARISGVELPAGWKISA